MAWQQRFSSRFYFIGCITLFVLIAIVPYFIDNPILKRVLCEAVAKHTQRTLSIEGGAYLVLLPRPTIIMNKLKLSEPNSHQIFLHADQIKLKLNVGPLFRGNWYADIKEIIFKQAQLNLIRHTKGQYNFDNLMSIRTKAHLFRFISLDAIQFEHSRFKVIDMGSHHIITISDLELKASNLQRTSLGNIEWQGHVSHPFYRWQAHFTGKATLHFNRDRSHLHIANINLNLIPNMAKLEPHNEKSSQPFLTQHWKTGSFNATGNLDYRWHQSLPALEGSMVFKGHTQYAEKKWQAQISLSQFRFASNQLSVDRAEARYDFIQEGAHLIYQAQMHHLVGIGQPFLLRTRDAQMNIELKYPSQNLRLACKSDLTFLSNPSMVSLSRFHLSGDYRSSLPGSVATFFQQGNAHINWRTQDMQLESQGSLNNAAMIMHIRSRYHDLMPSYYFNLAMEHLDLTSYVSRIIDSTKKWIDSEKRNRFSWLNTLHVDGKIDIKRLKVEQTHLEKVQLGLKIKNRILTVSPFTASAYNGNMSSKLVINNQNNVPQLRLKKSFSDIEIYSLFHDFFKLNYFGGKGYLQMDLAMSGENSTDWRRTLMGSLHISLARGTLKGLDILSQIERISQRIYPVNNELSAITQKKIYTQATRFNQLHATIFIKKGILYNTNLAVNTRLLKLSGKGSYDLNRKSINYTLYAMLNPQQLNGPLNTFSTYILPIHFSGKLRAPRYQIDYTYLQQQIEKRYMAKHFSDGVTLEKKWRLPTS